MSMITLDVTWDIEDLYGYVGKKPQITTMQVDDLDWRTMTPRQQEAFLQKWIRRDFDARMSFVIHKIDERGWK